MDPPSYTLLRVTERYFDPGTVTSEDMGAELKGLRAEVKEFRADANERLEKVEERLDCLAAKWMEHDEEIHKLKREQA